MPAKMKRQGFLNCKEVAPDKWDLAMLARCVDNQKSDYISLAMCLAELGSTYEDLGLKGAGE